MNLNRALAILAKKFAVNSDVFKTCSKNTVIGWAQQVISEGDQYQLSRHQHSFLIGDVVTIPLNNKMAFEF